MPKGLAFTGYLLALIGGILMIIGGALGFLGVLVSSILNASLFGEVAGRDLLTLILGIVAVIGARYVEMLGWAIALIVVGIVGQGLGGALVLVGGILGLVYRSTKR